MRKLLKISLTLFCQKGQKVRENEFTKAVTKELISRNIFLVREFLVLPHRESRIFLSRFVFVKSTSEKLQYDE